VSVSKIVRVIRQPKGNMLLIGIGGSGRQSLTRLASFICEYTTFQIEVTKHYRRMEFRDGECVFIPFTYVTFSTCFTPFYFFPTSSLFSVHSILTISILLPSLCFTFFSYITPLCPLHSFLPTLSCFALNFSTLSTYLLYSSLSMTAYLRLLLLQICVVSSPLPV